VSDFSGPDLAFTGDAGGGGGGGGFELFGGGGGGGGDEALDPDRVQEFIQSSVAPDTWENEGVAMNMRQGGTLFVSQTSDIHGEIGKLLTNLRNMHTLEVNVRIRMLDVRKSFMEEIGVEWNDVANDLLNSQTRWGANDVKREWAYGSLTSNEMPANASNAGFADTFGSGLRYEWLYNNNGVLNRPSVNGILEAIEQESDSEVVNAPELTCFNGQRANALFIRQYAYISDYAVAGENNYDPEISVLNYGDIIDIKPLVSADRKYVTLEVRPTSVTLDDVFVERITTVRQVNGVVFNSVYPLELPNVEVKALRTTCILPDKGSLLLGGYVKGLRQRTHSGIPVLSHIPFLGRLFSKNGIYDETRHLFFLVTVEIIDLSERSALQ
jgi:type II secretory pathway component GspD/PulD (secretin)